MFFHQLAQYFQKLEQITSRNTMTTVLAELFRKTSVEEIGKVCYLLQGRVVPLYEPLEFGMASKMVIKAIAEGLKIEQKQVRQGFKQTGDLGETVEKFKVSSFAKASKDRQNKQLNIVEVYKQLLSVAEASGAGSQEEKIKLAGKLIGDVDALSAKYIVRILVGKMRLGFSDMTILDALSWKLTGSKEYKKKLERAYNVRPDLAYIASSVKKKGISGLDHINPAPGTPIRMAKANRLSDAADIIKKVGKHSVEYKYDGLRLQVHLQKPQIKLFSRNLEDMTEMFPDIVDGIKKQIRASNAIFEGEVVAYNPKTGAFLPFQQTMQRKRKYDIAKKAAEIPVKLYCFELLYANNKNFMEAPYEKRKAALKKILKSGKVLVYAQEKIVSDETQVDQMFSEAVKLQFEGIISKKLDGLYEAGIRGWNWIKYKRAMSKKLADTLDVLVMGYTRGQGKRTAFGVGQFLTGIYDKKKDKFVTVSKIGTGLTDEQFRKLFSRVRKLHVKEKPGEYEVDKLLKPDVWLEPKLVVEISCDEITRSAVHTAGRVMRPSKSGKAFTVDKSGYALRFPRLERFRDDKQPEAITDLTEVKEMYAKQSKK